MGAAEIIVLVNGLLKIAFDLYEKAGQVTGGTPIPSWQELSDKNSLLQGKIDAELKG